jgi:uncharacterized protein YebE (UPF0316 family)
MFSAEFIASDIFSYLILPLAIFFMRITDVSMGTIRIIFVSRGNKVIAPILGFFEVLIWILAITNIMQHLDNWLCYVAWAGGFATGNYVGMRIEERLAIGVSLIRIVATGNVTSLTESLNSQGYGTTSLQAKGRDNDVSMIYTIVKRKDIDAAIDMVKSFCPTAFYTIEDVRYASHDKYPVSDKIARHRRFYLFQGWRKGK